jgi:hypothetical protein
MDQALRDVVKAWKPGPRESAERLVDYYGPPAEYSRSRMIWFATQDGWKRTELVNEEIPHQFPSAHEDHLEQVIDYRVPVDKYSSLAEFDGSVIVERTKGELSARCAGTSMNFLAINLAHEIATGQRSVGDARKEYARIATAFERGDKSPYTERFVFPLPHADTKDPDRPESS